jgi:hypothetical protein
MIVIWSCTSWWSLCISISRTWVILWHSVWDSRINLCSSYNDEIWTTWLCIGGLCYDDLFFTLGSFSTTICHNTILLSRSSGVDWVNVTWVFFTTKVSLVKQLHLVNFVLLISYKPPCFVSCVLFFQLLLGLFW